MTRRRIRNWSGELQRWANGLQGADFVWGMTDCCMLARRALAIMYDGEVAPQIPKWGSEAEAVRVWSTWNLRDVLLDLGATVTTLSYRQAGDILCWAPAVPTGPWPGIGVALQTGTVLVPGPTEGVLLVPAYVLPETTEAYHLPHAIEVRD